MPLGYPRLFTREEANALLPSLQPLVSEIVQSHSRILAAQPALAPILEKALGNGGSQVAAEVLPDFRRIRACLDAIYEHGVVVKDLGAGLLDFPASRDGELVYLCWRMGEDRVAFWHTPASGFAGRQPL
jgi:hypothetical protein